MGEVMCWVEVMLVGCWRVRDCEGLVCWAAGLLHILRSLVWYGYVVLWEVGEVMLGGCWWVRDCEGPDFWVSILG